MKSLSFLLLISAFAINSMAQNKQQTKSPSPQSASATKALSENSTKPVKAPTGPNSFGPLKIGMNKEAVESLTEKDSIYLATPMSPYVYKYSTATEGIDKFDAKLNSPLSSQPLEAVLSFKEDALQTIYISFKESVTVFEKVKAQISEKYGVGKQENTRKEEQCIYKNGANFKITTGTISQTWVDVISQTEQYETKISDYLYSSCPSNLRYGSVGEINLRSLTIDKKTVAPETPKPANLF